MRIALICPSNRLFMPYVDNYINFLDINVIKYDVINWDRLKIEQRSELTHRDSKTGHQRGFLDYLKYKRFVINHLKKKKYDTVVVFGIQLTYFLKRFIVKEYKNKFIIDIRDYNGVIKYFDMKKTIKSSAFTVLSSSGFKSWLPKSDKYFINNNTQVSSIDELRVFDAALKNNKVFSISYIGTIRDYEINIKLIESLKNINKFVIKYHGQGIINQDIQDYLIDKKINNVRLKGRYDKKQEPSLYLESDFINILIPTASINDRTLLPNRLFNSVLYAKPIITIEGTYLSEIVKVYNLGLVIDSFQNLEYKLMDYINNFDVDLYNNGRTLFFNSIIEENTILWNKFEEYLSSNF
jgi:hypothetical protein